MLTMPKSHPQKIDHATHYMIDLSRISMILTSSSIDRTVTFTLSIRTRFDSSTAPGSHRFTAHVQDNHVVIMCTLTLHFLCISSLDNRGLDCIGL